MIVKFSVQEHFAKRHHFDLRLEMDGVAKSWAIPKGFPEKGERRLAIQVEDHSIDYMEFEGLIEEGYGKGVVKLWDRGEYEILKKSEKELKFKLNGNKLNGIYVLLKFDKAGRDFWLIMKTSE
ncbi:MAG: DNA polymerase ligase N-terminal domain-containing protein [Archaeoglobaceae archaeon]|nr:DNA polymerase ligase N-terminal domain-containing protein [Archaeoglobales archaeon]